MKEKWNRKTDLNVITTLLQCGGVGVGQLVPLAISILVLHVGKEQSDDPIMGGMCNKWYTCTCTTEIHLSHYTL